MFLHFAFPHSEAQQKDVTCVKHLFIIVIGNCQSPFLKH